jgi:uncharacterized membrane protein
LKLPNNSGSHNFVFGAVVGLGVDVGNGMVVGLLVLYVLLLSLATVVSLGILWSSPLLGALIELTIGSLSKCT